ncbi:acid protease [Neofusicoccum parvum]|nr:acid protease [Neofusicoccum parvum]
MMVQSVFCATAIAPLALSAALPPASVAAFSKRTTEPAPVVVEPSQQWDGNDGPWSSFVLQVGTPAQQVRVDISIGGQETWVVDSGACDSSGSSTSNNCADERGGVFNIGDSSSWKSTTTIWNNSGIYKLSGLIPQELGIDGNGQYGFESVGLSFHGTTSPTLKHTVTAAFNTTTFSIGQFGVSPNPTYFTVENNNGSVFNDPQQSFLSILDSTNQVPSRSYSFTAGSQARRKSVKNALGSFIFGGYDMSLKGPNDMSFDFAPDEGRELVVGVRSITKTGNGATTELLPEAVLAALDSSQPNIWLPLEACRKFEAAFGLSWNSGAGQYLVNSTLHDQLVEENPSVTFRLGNGASGGPTVDIDLPYGAFDLNMSNSSTDLKAYFPLKRAENETQYTLGRAFFQEAYLIADYDRRNFSLSQRVRVIINEYEA